ncbi:MAG: 3-deoxy-manno-octulosonate cytidylyltransferase [Deltaproteobacteria bacterium]|nr:3-deoxy-manno-octulosonate cytidylyltransferase [Deltaproteobacteria bacterium]
MKIIAFIPARYDSTRFPGKPLALIAGRPLIERVYRRAQSCADITDVFVATDDERILRAVQTFGGKALMTGKEHPSGTDRIAEAAEGLHLKGEDMVINIQGDQPLLHPSSVSQLVSSLAEEPNTPMNTLMYRITDERDIPNPNHVKVVTDREGFALYFSRSPIPFYRDSTADPAIFKHLGLYGYRMEFLSTFVRLPVGRLESSEKLEQLRALEHGYRIKVLETRFDSVEVDTPGDIRKVEGLLAGSGERNP